MVNTILMLTRNIVFHKNLLKKVLVMKFNQNFNYKEHYYDKTTTY